MAMKQCPECGGDVSSSAASCPKCGKTLKMSTPKKLGMGCGLLFLFFLAIGIIGGKSATSDAGAGGTPSGPAAEVPAIEVTANDLIGAYGTNEVSADGQYKDKAVLVTGIVDKIGKDMLDAAYVTVGTGKHFEIPIVQCTFARSNTAAAAQLQPGQSIRVLGVVKGKMMNVQLADCQVR